MNRHFFTVVVLSSRNISKLYMIARGHWFPVCGLGNVCA